MDANQAGGRRTTYFEQVPVTVVKELVERAGVTGAVTCPRCGNVTGSILRAVTLVTQKEHYRCGSCLHVWTVAPAS